MHYTSAPPRLASIPEAEKASNYWRPTFGRRLTIHSNNPYVTGSITEDDGSLSVYDRDGIQLAGSSGPRRRLENVGSGQWRRTDDMGNHEYFYSTGQLFRVDRADGTVVSLAYPYPWMTIVSDQNGRKIEYHLNSSTGNITQIQVGPDPAANYSMSYDAEGRLTQITDGYNHRKFKYRPASGASPADGSRHLLEEVADKLDAQRSRYIYDPQSAKVIETYHFDGTGQINRYQYQYNFSSLLSPSVTVTPPLNGPTTYRFELATRPAPGGSPAGARPLGTLVLKEATQACASCGGSQVVQSTLRDSRGNPQRTTDFRGVVSVHEYDPTTDLEFRRTESANGLPGMPSCPANVGDCAQARRIWETDYHPSLRLPTEKRLYRGSTQSAAETIIRKVYNARGQVLASCTIDPAKPMAVQYQCGGSDTTPVGVRQHRFAYCEPSDPDFSTSSCPRPGWLRWSDGPKPSNSDATNYLYFAADHPACASSPLSCAYRRGDLMRVTNAAGHETDHLTYDQGGRVLRLSGPLPGVLTDMTYNFAGHLRSRIVRANPDGSPSAADSGVLIDYQRYGEAAGEIQRTRTLGDAFGLEYCRDWAHRIRSVVVSTGTYLACGSEPRASGFIPTGHEGVLYTLDAAGNKIREETFGTDGTVKRVLARQYDTLSRLKAQVRAAQAYQADPTIKTEFLYDANSNLDRITDPLGRITEHDHDALNRLIKQVQDLGGIAAEVEYEYDARDQLRKVIDPKGLTTEYVYDGLGNQITLISPDTGTTSYTYDSAGNRESQTDARGVETTYTYDALNRLLTIEYPLEKHKSVSFEYDRAHDVCTVDESYPVGRLTSIGDVSGQTLYCYDRFGNVRRKVQTVLDQVLTTEYRYNAANRLTGMTYPSGLVVAYGRDGQGRVNSVSLSRGTWSLPLVTQVSHQPFGPLSEMTFGYGQTLEKQWDANYEPDLIDSPAINYDYTLDDVGNLTQIQSTIEGEQRYEYDDLNRLETVREQNQTLIEQFAYDDTGNRTSHTVGTSTTGYTYPPDSHRLQQVGTQARTFDAAGNTLTGVSGYTARGLRGHYDHRNRLSHIGDLSEQFSARWEYNGRGERVYTRVSDLQAWTDTDDRYAYDESGQLIGSYRSVVEGKNFFRAEEIVWLDNTPVARVVIVPSQGAEEKGAAAGIEVHAIHTDHLGTPRALVNAQTQGGQPAGTVVWRWRLINQGTSGSNAFGAMAAEEDPDGNGTTVRFDLRFPGQQYDASTGLHYNYFRDYEAGTGRYVESDPIGLRGGVGTYVYGEADPFSTFDPRGLAPTELSDEDCCTAVRTLVSADADGTVACCNGRRIACVWYQPPPGPEGRKIAKCRVRHENSHLDDDGKCDEGCPALFRTPSKARNECDAYGIELDCLRREKKSCGKSSFCLQRIEAEIADRSDHQLNWCSKAAGR
jgi:RHS repeat-associated protein